VGPPAHALHVLVDGHREDDREAQVEELVVGALIGALFLGILKDGLILKGVNADYQLLYLGLAIILAMTINTYVQRVRRGSRHG
jgi:hypothetical protein